uniref:Uncharacterized protein n=1 Tax=Myoviridae sp. ctw4b6 TaxID=2825206 RepID=A0A8S5QDP6_9CAUD|nr:MAG TPA: hypothetical protein [Myoviridae sp. ctw4b6]
MIERDISRVRLLIADLPKDGEAGCGTSTLLTDTQVEDLLDLSGGNVKRAAARALRTIATSEVLLSKKITQQDLSVDGPAVAAELRAQADALDAEAQRDEDRAGGGTGDFWEALGGLNGSAMSEGASPRASAYGGGFGWY